MSFQCSKTYSIEEAFQLSAYWRFDEVYGGGFTPATWTDDVNGMLITGFEADSESTGLYGRSRKALNWAFTPNTNLGYNFTSEGFSIWFWMSKPSGSPQQIIFRMESYTDAFSPSYTLFVQYLSIPEILTVNLDTYIDDADPGETATISITPPWVATWNANGWCFVCVTYTQADGKIRLYCDDTAPTVSAANATMYDMPSSDIVFFYVGGTGYPAMDEFGICMNRVLDASQVTALYNSGLGMTWPDVNNL